MLWPCLICRFFPQRETSCLLSSLGLPLNPPQRSDQKSKQNMSVSSSLRRPMSVLCRLSTLGLYSGQSSACICFDCLPIPSSSTAPGITFSRAGVLPGSCLSFLLCFSRSLCLVLSVYVCCSKVVVFNLGVLTPSTHLYLQKRFAL